MLSSLVAFPLVFAAAPVQPHDLFTSHMVLQRGKPIQVWGSGAEGAAVRVSLGGHAASARVKGGKWSVTFRPMQAGGPHTMTITGPEGAKTFEDVLIGDVWVASGQSNMEWAVDWSGEPDKAKEKANRYPNIRLFTVNKRAEGAPVANVIGSGWKVCSAQTVGPFSAVAFHFGARVYDDAKVPIGLINTSWGGTPAEAWTTRERLETMPTLADRLKQYDAQIAWYERRKDDLMRTYNDAVAAFQAAQRENRPTGQWPTHPDPRQSPWGPATLYNGMVAPLRGYGAKGFIWYQGESNAGRAYEYRTLMAQTVLTFREAFGGGDLPFYQVQLAPFMDIQKDPGESQWAELREAQNIVGKRLRNVGAAVIVDAGDEKDIHPRDKVTVGNRLGLLALRDVYGKKIAAQGPTLQSARFGNGQATLRFSHCDNGLLFRGERLQGFSIAGDDKKFVWGNAEIVDGFTVRVSHPSVPNPKAVRYGWANYPTGNLWNGDGLPASPFRTDVPK